MDEALIGSLLLYEMTRFGDAVLGEVISRITNKISVESLPGIGHTEVA